MNLSSKMTDYTYIRKLLDLYYEGISTREQERELASFFAEAKELPEEFEADRLLFVAMADTDEDIPEALDVRIMSALRRESKRGKAIRALSFAAAAAAVLALLFVGIRLIAPEKTVEPEMKTPLLTVVGGPESGVQQTDTAFLLCLEQTQQADKKQADLKKAGQPAEMKTAAEEIEPEAVAEANYRVIDNETEAYEIVNSVFMRLDDNISKVGYRIDGMQDEYEMQISKL